MSRTGLFFGIFIGLALGAYLAATLNNTAWVAVGLVLGVLGGNILFSGTTPAPPTRKRRTDDDDDDDDDDEAPEGAHRFHRYEDHEADYYERSDYYDEAEDQGGF